MRALLSSPRKLYLTLFLLTFLATLMLPRTAHGQDLELSGGYAHVIQTCSQGQSRVRLVLGLTYTFGCREMNVVRQR